MKKLSYSLVLALLCTFAARGQQTQAPEHRSQAQQQAQAPQDPTGRRLEANYRAMPLESVLNDLKTRAGVRFLYFNETIPAGATVTINKTAPVRQILNEALTPAGLSWSLDNGVVVISRTAQQGTQRVTGRVTDPSGRPLAGVAVQVEGTGRGVSTDARGNYSIALPTGGGTITFSYMGMKTATRTTQNARTLDVQLEEAIAQTEQVVVTGYANIAAKGFTGSQTTVRREDLLKVSSGNVLQTLQVFDPSLRVATNNQMGSDPNTMPELSIRGESGIGITDLDRINGLSEFSLKVNPNMPLFILDGHEVSVEKVYDLDPYRINTLTILKDAAATAMYGSRASNGIVVIETIAPQPGKVRATYNMTGKFVVPDLNGYNLMTAREKAELEYRIGAASTGGANGYSALEDYQNKMNAINRGVDTYWLSQPLRTVFTHTHNAWIEGGQGDQRFGIGLNYGTGNGAMKGSYRRTMGAHIRNDFRMGKVFLSNDLSFDRMSSQDSPYGSFKQYVDMQPYWAPRNLDTGELNRYFYYTTDIVRDQAVNNPLYEAEMNSYKRAGYWEVGDNMLAQMRVGAFQLKAKLSMSYRRGENRSFLDPESGKNPLGVPPGKLDLLEEQKLHLFGNVFGSYAHTIGDHAMNLNLGLEAQQDNSSSSASQWRGFQSVQFDKPRHAQELVGRPSQDDIFSRSVGAIFTGNYTFRDTWLVDASVRMDGSSQFGRENRFAPFWSLGAGVNMHHFEWMQRLRAIDMLKLRANIGEKGRVGFSPFDAVNTYNMIIDNPSSTGYGAILRAMGNDRLSWDKTRETNIGFDLSLWHKLTVNFSWYDKLTRDQVTQVSLPSSSGFKHYVDNMGDTSNRGFELAVSYAVFHRPDWDVNVSANAAHNKNKILRISKALEEYNKRVDDYFAEYTGNSWQGDESRFMTPVKKYVEGASLSAIYGMRSLGISPANGHEFYLRRDGTTTWDWSSAEQVVIGDTRPDLQGSFTLAVRYKKLSLFASFLYEFGGDTYNQTLVERAESVKLLVTNADRRLLTQAWQKPGDVVPFKRIEGNTNLETRPTSRFVQKNNFVKFNSLSLKWDFDRAWIAKAGFQRLSLQLNMNDIATLSTVKQERGTVYPYAHNFGFTINAGF